MFDNDSTEKLTKKDYTEIVVEAGMQAIPVVGGPLATLYFGQKQEKRFKRLETLYTNLSHDLNSGKYSLPPIEAHNPEELKAIIEELHDKVETEYLETKLKYYKQYFKNTLISPVQGNYDERKMFLDILSQISPLQIELIVFLTTQPSAIKQGDITKPGVESALIQGSINQLKNLGLIKGVLNQISFGGTGNSINEDISLTSFGQKFHTFCLQ
ncbi:hypothetical protein [Zhenhengia sp.]|uniref:hypothetical protein n=1 Tax=Zhenhengia sp. TaxID=2944208 RepID=UPI00307A8483